MPPVRPQGRLLDRKAEQRRLADAWREAKRTPQFVALEGRRRVGKTYLLAHVAAGKRGVFFGATQQSEVVELQRLHEAVVRDMGAQVGALTGGGFQSWSAAFKFFFAVAADKPTILVLDEIPYLTQSTNGFGSILQYEWDHRPRTSKLLLVACGSAISTMTALFGPRGPLRDRPTLRMHVDPLSAYEARPFLPRVPAATFFEVYAACGGYPLHLLRWDPHESVEHNLLTLAASAGGILLEDAQSMLHEELGGTATHAQVLGAIGRGRTTFSKISSELAPKKIAYSLNLLDQAGFIRKVVPLGASRSAHAVYEIGDAYLNFWYRVLSSDAPLIDAGQGAAVLRRRHEEWQRHLGWVFEEAARDHARRLVTVGALPRDLLVGRWWRNDHGIDVEIDVLGMRGHETTLIGSAKWGDKPLTPSALSHLQKQAAFVPSPAGSLTYALWSRGGAEPAVRRTAQVYTPADMLR